jgi:uncharacterized 2Fe-2S/4Fe-4S cluster protein (DUF4445 family)
MRSGAELKGEVLDRLGARVREGATGRGFTVVECGADGAVVLLARDVREVQLAVAAIRAGVAMLGQEAGITPDEIGAVYVAGNFGNFVRKTSLLRLGLLPIRDPRRVHLVGNAAGLAARLALLDARFRRRVERAATEATYVELGGRPDYGTAFVDALEFPAAVPR